MTGAQLLTYVKRRLAENGFTVPDERRLELCDYISEARDFLLQVFAEAAPVVVAQEIALTVDVVDDRKYIVPVGTKDPLRITKVVEATSGADLEPAASLNNDLGHYVWKNIRTLRLADNVQPDGGVTIEGVFHAADIDDTTAEAAIGLPTPCHRAIGKYAAVLALTADEESDATNAMKLFAGEMDRLEKIYGEYDANAGLALRNALLAGIGAEHGDLLS